MKIQPLIVSNVKSKTCPGKVSIQKENLPYQSSTVLQAPSYNLSFKGFSPKYFRAQAYLNSVKEKLGGSFEQKATDVYKMDLNKLNGIQEGIKVFKGLSFKEITFIARSLFSVAVTRGCSNLCSHCYAEAVPHKKETSEYINKMRWDDFTSLIDGFSAINKRIGFYLSGPNLSSVKPNRDDYHYITAFHDSDCMELSLRDSNDKEHDFIEISEKIADVIGIRPLFDTSGWTPKNKNMQKKAEKYVAYYMQPDNIRKFAQFNVSLNPFHALNTRSVQERRAGNIEKAEKFQNLYVERMANVFFTFTPLLKRGSLNILYRAAMYDSDIPVFDGFRIEDLNEITKKILIKLKKMYEEDFNGEQKYITNKKQIKDCIFKIQDIIRKKAADFALTGRSVKTFGKNNSYYENAEDKIALLNKEITGCKTPQELLYADTSGIVDANGDYYITTFFSTYPTELKLNFENKNKKTAPISPSLQEDLVIRKNVINNCNKED